MVLFYLNFSGNVTDLDMLVELVKELVNIVQAVKAVWHDIITNLMHQHLLILNS